MTTRRRSMAALILAMLTPLALAHAVQLRSDLPSDAPQDQFVRLGAVTLHYLDWGGSGDLMLFLAGLTHTAHTYDQIAPAFTGHFHVMGLTRRGHGASDKPRNGYDLATLADDIVGFIDAVGAERVVLVGHSFAGLELPEVARRIPDRMVALIFLDAVRRFPPDTTPLPPDSTWASFEALKASYQRGWLDDYNANAPIDQSLRSMTYMTADGRIAWQISRPIRLSLWETLTREISFRGLDVPVLALWSDQARAGAEAMRNSGTAEAEINAFETWAREVDVPLKLAMLDSLKAAVPDAEIVKMDALHGVHWQKPVDVVGLIDRFLSKHHLE